MAFDIDQAVQYLDSHAYATTQGKCATFVANAISAKAGGGLPLHTVLYAKNFGPELEAAGFEPVTDGTIQKGDVAVIQNYAGGNVAGHMDMYDGSRWVSDFKQSGGLDPYPGPGYRKARPDYTVYRYKGRKKTSDASGVQGITDQGAKLALGEQHGVQLGPNARHLSHQLALLEGGGEVTAGSPTVFVGRGQHPVARVDDATTKGPIQVGERTVLVG